MELSNKSMKFFNDTADSIFVSTNVTADQVYNQKAEDELTRQRRLCDEVWKNKRDLHRHRRHEERSQRFVCPPFPTLESTRLEEAPHVVVPDYG
jgi:hypothetical protein